VRKRPQGGLGAGAGVDGHGDEVHDRADRAVAAPGLARPVQSVGGDDTRRPALAVHDPGGLAGGSPDCCPAGVRGKRPPGPSAPIGCAARPGRRWVCWPACRRPSRSRSPSRSGRRGPARLSAGP